MPAIAALSPGRFDVEPGGRASVVVRVRNGGAIVDRFDISIVGPLAAWARAEPPSLSLFPGEEGQSTVVFAPPRAPYPRAGTYPYGVRVAPAADPAGAAVEEGRATVGPFYELAADIVPQTSRGSRVGRHEVVVENRGNAPVNVALAASDPDRLLAFVVAPERLAIEPGERAGTHLRATAGDTFLRGSRQTHPFAVEITPSAGRPIALRGSLLQGPILPAWLIPAGGLALAAAAAFVVLPLLAGSGNDPRAANASASAASSPTLTPSPSSPPVSPSPSESASPAPTDTGPTPSPTPGEFVVLLPNEGEPPMSGALQLLCPAADDGCRARVRDDLQLFINALGARYDGYGVSNPGQPDVPNTLPVVLSRDVPFTWRSDTGAIGTSDVLLVDLAPLIADTPSYAYAVVETGDGTTQRFVVPHGTADQLFKKLYAPKPQVTLPEWTLPDKADIGQVYLWNNAFYDNLFLAITPTP